MLRPPFGFPQLVSCPRKWIQPKRPTSLSETKFRFPQTSNQACTQLYFVRPGLWVTSFIYKYKTSNTYSLYETTWRFVLINKWRYPQSAFTNNPVLYHWTKRFCRLINFALNWTKCLLLHRSRILDITSKREFIYILAQEWERLELSASVKSWQSFLSILHETGTNSTKFTIFGKYFLSNLVKNSITYCLPLENFGFSSFCLEKIKYIFLKVWRDGIHFWGFTHFLLYFF